MLIQSVFSDSFKKYGRIINDDFSSTLKELKKIPYPEKGVKYVAKNEALENTPDYLKFEQDYFGGMSIQIGYCAGFNKVTSALEYHKSSEINIANEDFILVLGERKDIIDGKYDLSKVELFLVPKRTAIEIYATTLHYCPISSGDSKFNMLVVLPLGTNVGRKESQLEPMLRCTNKWLICHEDSKEAINGAYVGLIGNKVVVE